MAKVTKIQSAVTGDEYQVQNLDVQQSTGQSTEAVMSQKATTDALATKQGTIDDLQTIRSGAAAGAAAYQKPSSGIPSSDMASGVQNSLGKADTAIQPGNVKQTTGESTGDVMSQKAVTDELEKKANKDGYYSTLTAGAAENLTGQNADTATWEERPVGGEGAEVATGLASVQAIGGNGCAWNQLVKNPNIEDTTYISSSGTLSANDNVLEVTPAENNYTTVTFQGTPWITGHKYFIRASAKLSAAYESGSFNIRVPSFNEEIVYFDLSTTEWQTLKTIKTAIQADITSYSSLGIYASAAIQDKYYLKKVNVIDLTIPGIDNLTTVAEVEAWLAANNGTKPYYPQNVGTLLPAKLQGYKTTGKSANLLNPTTRTARLFAYTWPDHSNMFTIKELPSDLTLTFTPDATGVAETITPDSNGHFSVSGSGNLVVSGSADLSATWLIATWDESMDDYDNFEAWDGKEYAFDTSKVYGKLNGAGDYVQVFPNGMRGAGSARDVLNLAKAEAMIPVKEVDLGDLYWSLFYSTNVNGFLSSEITGGKQDGYVGMINSKYAVLKSQGGSNYDNLAYDKLLYKRTAFGGLKVMVNDSTYSDAATFKTAMAGVKLWYELATPLVYTDCVYRNNGIDTPLSELNILVNNWAYEQAVVSAADNNGQPTSCAAQSTILYGIDAVEQLDTLKETGITVADLGNNLRALAAVIGPVMGGTLTVNDPSSGKTFGFSFTPSETPAES